MELNYSTHNKYQDNASRAEEYLQHLLLVS